MQDQKYKEVLNITVEKDIPIPNDRKSGLTAMLKPLQEAGDSILLPVGIKKSSIYPSAKALGFKVKIREEFGQEEVKKWSDLTNSMAWQKPLIGIRVWRIN